MSSLKHNKKQERLLTVALIAAGLLLSATSPARAVDWLETLGQTLGQQGTGVISESGQLPSQGQSVPQSTGGQPGGGVISESGQSGVGSEILGAAQDGVGNVINGALGQVSGTTGGTLGSTGGQPGGGVISESGQSGVGAEISDVAQNGADNVIDGVFGQVKGKIGSVFGNRGGVVGQFLNPFEQLMQKYIGAAQTYLHNAVGKFLGSIFGTADPVGAGTTDGTTASGGADGTGASDGADGTTATDVISAVGANVPPGTMGLPDFDKVKTEIENKAKSGADGAPSVAAQKVDRFNLNPIALSRSLSAEQDRTLVRTISASVLSDEGQQAMTAERAAATQTLKQIQAKAQEAQGLDVTQDVMKNLTQIVAGQASLESGTYAQTMLVHQQLSANGVIESNISEALDETNRARRVEAMAGASRLLHSASALYLPGS